MSFGPDACRSLVPLCGTGLALLAALLPSACAAQAAARPGLVLEYRFGVDASDSGGGGLHGRTVGAVAWANIDGRPCLALDGADAHVEAPSTLPGLTDSFAIECWVRPAPGQRKYADILGNHRTEFVGFALQQDGAKDNAYYFTYGTGTAWVYSRTVQLTPDVWQHVAIVKARGVMRFYVDGLQVDRVVAPAPLKPSSTPMLLGLGIAGEQRHFKGALAELRVWDRPCPLTPVGSPRKQQEAFARSARLECALPSRWGLIRPGKLPMRATLSVEPECVPPAVEAIDVALALSGPGGGGQGTARLTRGGGFTAPLPMPSAPGLYTLAWKPVCPTPQGPLALAQGSVRFAVLGRADAPECGQRRIAMPTPGRTTLSSTLHLSGRWMAATDPDNAGRTGRWFAAPRKEARALRAPGALQEAFPGYHGVAWYWRRFNAPANPHPGGRTLLRFEAVDYLAEAWLNGKPLGRHEGGETPFELDATAAVKPGADNLLAVRVLNPTHTPIEGMTLNTTPRRAKVIPYSAGASYNHGGVVGEVELACTPAIHITDLYAVPDWKSGSVDVRVSLASSAAGSAPVAVEAALAPAAVGCTVDRVAARKQVAPGASVVTLRLQAPRHRLWDVRDPFLYRVTVGVTTGRSRDERSVRIGFRDFRLERSAFRLNGRRLFLRSTHTVNAYPVGQQIAMEPDLFRKDALYLKTMGFNCIRFIWGGATRAQLDVCDEMGLMVYQEHAASNPMEDGPQMAARFDLSLGETILRDRNHPSVVIWGLLNETFDNAVFRHAAASLPLVRSLDQTRAVMLNSGRWDGQRDFGSVCNPGAEGWDGYLGGEGPGKGPTGMAYPGGYATDMGDVHAYPHVPHSAADVAWLRELGAASGPVLLSEYGIGSAVDLWRVTRRFEQIGHADAEDALYYSGLLRRFMGDWTAWSLADTFADPQAFFAASLAKVADQRRLGLDAIRSNPKIIGHNVTGMMDHVNCGEGIFTLFRDLKPGSTDAFYEAFAPLRFCLFAEPRNLYRGGKARLEAVLANEDALPAGSYPVRLQMIGPDMRRLLDRTVTVTVPPSTPGAEAPLALPFFSEEVTVDGPAGAYRFTATMEQGGAPTGGDIRFDLDNPAAMPALPPQVALWGADEKLTAWLAAHGCAARPFDRTSEVILVGSGAPADEAAWQALLERVRQGATAAFLAPEAFRVGDDPVARLPLERKGALVGIHGWLYLKDEWAKTHPIFAGLPTGGLMDTTFYREVIPDLVFTGQDPPSEAVAGAIKASQDYASGLMLSVYRVGKGQIVLNTLRITENLGSHPAADRLLRNLLRWASAPAEEKR